MAELLRKVGKPTGEPMGSFLFSRSVWCHDLVDATARIPKGTKVVLPDIWAWYVDGESYVDQKLRIRRNWKQTPSYDIEIILEKDCSLNDAFCQLEQLAIERLRKFGTELRGYFVESADVRTDGSITFFCGT